VSRGKRAEIWLRRSCETLGNAVVTLWKCLRYSRVGRERVAKAKGLWKGDKKGFKRE